MKHGQPKVILRLLQPIIYYIIVFFDNQIVFIHISYMWCYIY